MTKRELDALRRILSWIDSGMSPRAEGRVKQDAETLGRFLDKIDPRRKAAGE